MPTVETSGFVVLAIVALGMGIAFFAADPNSPTSRVLALLFCELAAILFLNVPIYSDLGLLKRHAYGWGRVFGVFEALSFTTGYEWLLRIRRTELAREETGGRGEKLFRIAQGLAVFHGVLSLFYPGWRPGVWEQLDRGRGIVEVFGRPEIILATVPIYASLVPASISISELARSKPDAAEVVRVNAMAVAAPFLFSGMFLPGSWMPITMAIGLSIFLVGAIRYHVRQGERGQFLARFLSPQVAELVRERGLATAMEHSRSQISVVACDLRGFTSFSESAAPEEVISLLRDYHAAVSSAVSEFAGTIKDFAGDGALVLVGAPISYADHASRAVRMALRMRQRTGELLARWQGLGLEIGLGIGIASGYVTVGVTGGDERLEYAAVGPAVNLASRLCARAESGQVLVDQRTVGLVDGVGGAFRFEKQESVELKGISRPVTVYALGTGENRLPPEAA